MIVSFFRKHSTPTVGLRVSAIALCRTLALAVLLAGFLAGAAFAAPSWEVPAEVSQGRAFVVTVTDSKPFRAELRWQNKTIILSSSPNNSAGAENAWAAEALLGVPMDARGAQALSLRSDEHSLSAEVRVITTPWTEQRVTVEPKYVEPPREVQDQIARDLERNKKVLASLRPERDWNLPFQRPVSGTVSSAFGGRRVFNGQPRSPHKGTDLRGAEGTPVLAVASGVVALAEPQYFSGNVVYIDHGQGVVSLYAHLSAFDVKPGDRVERGQVIGRVGATGRVTGPHLHLGLVVQGVAVDAMPLFDSPLKIVGGPTPEVKPTVAGPAAPLTSGTAGGLIRGATPGTRPDAAPVPNQAKP